MKQIESYSDYTVIKDWTDEELENTFTENEKKNWKKLSKECTNCSHPLSFIINNNELGIDFYLTCTYCHKEQYINNQLI